MARPRTLERVTTRPFVQISDESFVSTVAALDFASRRQLYSLGSQLRHMLPAVVALFESREESRQMISQTTIIGATCVFSAPPALPRFGCLRLAHSGGVFDGRSVPISPGIAVASLPSRPRLLKR